MIAAIFWAFGATITALLPYRRQFIPGIILLVAAPALIIWVGAVHGWLAAVFAVAAFLSMFRNPLIYLARRATGRTVTRPDQMEPRE